jgi:PleD family two-component response regulator
MKLLLDRIGVTTHFACNELEATAIFQMFKIDIIVTDFLFPKTNGVKIANATRTIEKQFLYLVTDSPPHHINRHTLNSFRISGITPKPIGLLNLSKQ